MVTLDLTAEEQTILLETLDNCLSDLSVEIADTDLKDYRDELKVRRGALEKVAVALKN